MGPPSRAVLTVGCHECKVSGGAAAPRKLVLQLRFGAEEAAGLEAGASGNFDAEVAFRVPQYGGVLEAELSAPERGGVMGYASVPLSASDVEQHSIQTRWVKVFDGAKQVVAQLRVTTTVHAEARAGAVVPSAQPARPPPAARTPQQPARPQAAPQTLQTPPPVRTWQAPEPSSSPGKPKGGAKPQTPLIEAVALALVIAGTLLVRRSVRQIEDHYVEVLEGDTLYSLAKRHNVMPAKLIQANASLTRDANVIYPGMEVKLPR